MLALPQCHADCVRRRTGRRQAHAGWGAGDQEDIAGHPFVGPAGKLLDRALADAGIDRTQVYVSNVVKHFKNEPRGKKRLHKKPNRYEVEVCKVWLGQEVSLVKAGLVLAMGVTAAEALASRHVTLARERDKELGFGEASAAW